jgi:hypothetical protein
MWFWPKVDRGSLSGFTSAELPFVIAIALLVAAGAIVYWIKEDEDSPGIHVFGFFWKLFSLLGLPALAILNWNYNLNFDPSWLVFSVLLSLAAAISAFRVVAGKRFAKSKPIANSIARDLNVLLIILTGLAVFNMLNDLALNEVVYTLLSALVAIATFINLAKSRKQLAGKKKVAVSELSGLTAFALMFFALIIGLLVQYVVRRLGLGDVWQSLTFWIVLVVEVAFNSLMLLSMVGQSEQPTKKTL